MVKGVFTHENCQETLRRFLTKQIKCVVFVMTRLSWTNAEPLSGSPSGLHQAAGNSAGLSLCAWRFELLNVFPLCLYFPFG